MYALEPPPKYQSPSRLAYRFRRFLFSKTWWAVSRLVFPLLVIAFLGFQIFTSSSVREFVTTSKDNVVEWVAFLPGLKITQLQIQNATKLQEDEIWQALDIEMPTSILLVDRDELRENMSTFDEIGDSSFRFGFNGTLLIELKPRIPAMIYFDEQEMITVDAEGHRVEFLDDREKRKELFVISGAGALDAAGEANKIIKSLNPFASQIRGLVRMGERRWDIVLTNGARIMLPAEKPLQALSLALRQHQQNDVLNREIEAYDLRNPERPILRLKSDAVEKIKAAKEQELDGQDV